MRARPPSSDGVPRAPGPQPASAATAVPRDAFALLPVCVFTGLGLILRLLDLGREALWFDEVNTLWRASGPSLRAVVARIAGDVQAPLYDVFIWIWTAGASATEAARLRLPSALASAALIPVTALLARDLGLRRRGQVLAAALLALAPFQVRFAQEARPYALCALLAGLLLLAAARVAASGGRRGLLLLAVAGPLLALTHYYGALLWLAVAAVLLLDAAACRERLSRLLWALLPAVAGLLLWAPVALRQFQLKEMNGVYRPLDGAALLEFVDSQGVHGALALPRETLAASFGALAPLAPAAAWFGRALLVALVVAGAWGCWRLRRERAPASASARGPSPACRGPALALLALAALALAGGLLPESALGSLAGALFKGGRALDAENLATLARLQALAPAGAALFAAAAAVVGLALPRWARAGRRLPALALPAAAIALVLLSVALLDLTGKRTLATRNLIGLSPACAVLAASGLVRLRAASVAGWRVVLGLLAVLALASLLLAPAYGAKADWRGAALAIQASGAEPIASPPWVARCVEFHTGRAWNAVFGSRRADEVVAWAAGRPAVMLVRQFDDLEDSGPVVAALTAAYGPPQVQSFRGGLRCELYGGR